MENSYVVGPDDVIFSSKTMSDDFDRFQILGDGRITTGDGTAAPTVTATLSAAGAVTFTQTYSTAATTVPAATSVDPTAITGGESPTEAEHNTLITAITATNADVLALKKVVNKIIDVLQAVSIAG